MSTSSRKLLKRIRLMINAGGAKPSPPTGPALGQAGLNIMQFCKDFNAKTAHIKPDVPMRVYIQAYEDKTFTYNIRPPTATYFIKQALGLEKLAAQPGHEIIGQISIKHIYEIAKVKRTEHPYNSLRSFCAQLAGNCRVMGVEVVRNIETDTETEEAQEET